MRISKQRVKREKNQQVEDLKRGKGMKKQQPERCDKNQEKDMSYMRVFYKGRKGQY